MGNSVGRIAFLVSLSFVIRSVVAESQEANAPPIRHSLSPTSANGRIVGVVVDSLHDRPLASAEVLIEGKIVAVRIADSAGHFSINDVPAGKYRLAVSHPWLDTLGISLITPDFFVVADSISFIRLGVPSASTLIDLKCKRSSPPGTGSAIIGHIVSAASLNPTPNVEVTLNWTTYAVSKIAGVQKTPHVERDTTGRSGAYKICGLPNDLEANLEARVAGNLRSESRGDHSRLRYYPRRKRPRSPCHSRSGIGEDRTHKRAR